jgi:hypothetical protein
MKANLIVGQQTKIALQRWASVERKFLLVAWGRSFQREWGTGNSPQLEDHSQFLRDVITDLRESLDLLPIIISNN